MKTKIFVIIDPNDVQKARTHLSTLCGKYLLPNTYKIKVKSDEVETACNAIEYILAGINFEFIIMSN